MTNSFDATTSAALQTRNHSLLLSVDTREPVWLNSARGRREQKRQKNHCVTHPKPVIVCTSIPWSLGGKMDGYGYGQLSWHFIQGPLTFPCSNVMHITHRSTPDQCLSEDKCCTSVLFMFNQICNMGINVRFMANLGYDKSSKLCKYMCFEI